MRRRERVPAALHSELTEYASLLRALRASQTSDLSQNLLQDDPYHDQGGASEAEDIILDDSDEHLEVEVEVDNASEALRVSAPPTSSSPISRNVSPASALDTPAEPQPTTKKRKRVSTGHGNKLKRKKSRSLWDRWPLLVKDVPIPEWTLSDEVAQITETFLRQQRLEQSCSASPVSSIPSAQSQSSSPAPHSPDDGEPANSQTATPTNGSDDSDSEAELHEELEQYAPHLTRMTFNYLSTILSHLLVNTPKRPPSLQNRAIPIDWRFLLDTLRSSTNPELADPEIIANVKARLEEEYGFDDASKKRDDLYQHRMEQRLKAVKDSNAKLSNPLDILLRLPSL